MDEAEENLDLAQLFMVECSLKANSFILAVQAIGEGEDGIRADILAALALYSGIDATTDGVSGAKASLDSKIKAYNNALKAANSAVDAGFDVAFGGAE